VLDHVIHGREVVALVLANAIYHSFAVDAHDLDDALDDRLLKSISCKFYLPILFSNIRVKHRCF
jgi:hypothetical protein